MKLRHTFAVAIVCFMGTPHFTAAQQQQASLQGWEKAAGGSMRFEVASVRPSKGEFQPPSFALSADAWFREPNGRFHADFELPTYIEFAYKLWLSPGERKAMLANLPTWVETERFSIEAVAPAHATKDQYRLMMQALLAERFGLRLHFAQTDAPVFAMVLVKPGLPGPRLIPHDKGLPCDAKPELTTYPADCYSYSAKPAENGTWLNGSRATSLDLLANFIGSTGGWSGETNRPVVDQTGLHGLWDFTLEDVPPSQAAAPSQSGPTLLEALRDQLGIRLKPARATITVPVIDRLQQPTEN